MATTQIDRRRPDGPDANPERFDTIVIGGGQAGLTAGYQLKQRGVPFVILDKHERIGDAWRTRWDSLRLFTPASYAGLPGWPFPAPRGSFPTKDELADYLEAYAAKFELTGTERRHRRSALEAWRAVRRRSGRSRLRERPRDRGYGRAPRAEGARSSRASSTRGSCSCTRASTESPAQLRDGEVLLVGAGNSGAEIAYELSAAHRTWLAGPDVGQVPAPHGSRRSRLVFPLVVFVFHHVLSNGNPIGRKVGPKLASHGAPLIRRRRNDLAAAGIERLPRVVGVRDGLPLLEDDRVLEPANVVWCTGFRQDFSWIDLPVFDEDGLPEHDRGIVTAEPGLYFLGLVFQHSFSSDVLPNRGRDAGYIAKHLAKRVRAS